MGLGAWVGKKNYDRKKVTPEGQDFVRSSTLGLVSQHTGEHSISALTQEHMQLTRLLSIYALTHASEGFVWTTITINDDFASVTHRDTGNKGPSFIAAAG